MRNILKSLSTVFPLTIMLVMIQCRPMTNLSSANEKTLIIASQTVDCMGVAPMRCLQVKEKGSDSWGISTVISKVSLTNPDLNMF